MRFSQYPEASPPMFVSYARNFEDVILNRAFADIETGFYIDVGANDPVEGSVTKSLYDRGWSGINIEAAPAFYHALCKERSRDINLCCLVGHSNGIASFYDVAGIRGASSPRADWATHYANKGFPVTTTQVAVFSLSDICQRLVGDRTIHLLRLDAAGAEADVVLGMSFERWRPWVIVVEVIDPITGDEQQPCVSEILKNGYRAVYFDGLNRFMVADEHAEIARRIDRPPNVFDQFMRSGEARARSDVARLEGSLAAVNEQLRVAKTARLEHESDLKAALEAGRRSLEQAVERLADPEQGIVELAEQTRNMIDRTCQEMLDQAQRYRTEAENVRRETGRAFQGARDESELRIRALLELEAELRLRLRDHREAHARAMAIHAATLATAKAENQVSQSAYSEKLLRSLADAERDIVECDQRIRVVEEKLVAKDTALRLQTGAMRRTCDELGDALRAKKLELTSEIRRLSEDAAKARQEHACSEQLLRDQIQERQNELTRIYASKSWMLTHPLRAANIWVGSGRRFLRRAASAVATIPRGALRRLGVAALNALRTRPALHARVVHRLESFPSILAHGRAFARNHRPTPALLGVDRRRQVESLNRRGLELAGSRVKERRANASECADRDSEPTAVMVFVDHTVSCSVNTGVQRVVRQLARALIELGERPIPVKWDSAGCQLTRVSAKELEDLALWNGPVFSDILLQGAEGSRQLNVDESYVNAIHCGWLIVPEVTHTNFHGRDTTFDVIQAAKNLGIKTAFIFHDAIPLRRQEFASVAGIHAEYMRSLLLADLVWPVSRWAGTDLVSYWSSSEAAELSSMPVVDVLSESGEVSGVARRGRIQEQSAAVILSIGTIEPRKNQVTLIHAFERIRASRPNLGWRLVLVGNLHSLVAEEVRSAVKRDSAISYLGHVSDEELVALHEQCAFTVFPSIEEGFGLPILESLWFGKPCICANFGAMAEVAEGGGCVAIDTRSVEAVAEAIEGLIDDPDRLGALMTTAINRKLPTWKDYARNALSSMRWESSAASHLGTVYYWVDHTIGFYKNTGIQRVTRNLARSLMESGVSVCPVKWDAASSAFVMPTQDELAYLHRWNGPAPTLWSPWADPSGSPAGSWFLMPELPLHYGRRGHAEILHYARTAGLSTAAIFYDAIPWKMLEIYPEHFSTAHGEYMEDLNGYDLVLAISEFSREDLVSYLGAKARKLTGLDERIRAVMLAGEFLENPRVVDSHARNRDEIVILCVGTVEPRKNHIVLLDAFEEIVRRGKADIRLMIVGRRTDPDLARAVRERVARNPGIIWNDDADDRSLAQLYRECDFTVFPSVEEGFGLPILESLWNGKPCICADFGAMSEVAAGGGCVAVDVRDTKVLADAIASLVDDKARRSVLTQQALKRPFKAWSNYADEIAEVMAARARSVKQEWSRLAPRSARAADMGLDIRHRPLLSVCITTFNRADWLAKCLENWSRIQPSPSQEVELIVCDNASTDNTREVIEPYERRLDFCYRRNEVNVGRLGNLSKAAQTANGKFIWIIGDDDLLLPGCLDEILKVIQDSPSLSLLYLNYATSNCTDPREFVDFRAITRGANPIARAERDRFGEVSSLCAINGDFFSAIGALVLRRDHALRAYSQNTHGRPFSTMLTSIPTSHYVLHNLMGDQGCWIGAPQIVRNICSSAPEYASLRALERMPEAYDLAELLGGDASEIDRWRRESLGNVEYFFGELYRNDPLGNAEYFSPRRLVWRFNHLDEFRPIAERLARVYRDAHARNHPAAKMPPAKVFPRVALE